MNTEAELRKMHRRAKKYCKEWENVDDFLEFARLAGAGKIGTLVMVVPNGHLTPSNLFFRLDDGVRFGSRVSTLEESREIMGWAVAVQRLKFWLRHNPHSERIIRAALDRALLQREAAEDAAF